MTIEKLDFSSFIVQRPNEAKRLVKRLSDYSGGIYSEVTLLTALEVSYAILGKFNLTSAVFLLQHFGDNISLCLSDRSKFSQALTLFNTQSSKFYKQIYTGAKCNQENLESCLTNSSFNILEQDVVFKEEEATVSDCNVEISRTSDLVNSEIAGISREDAELARVVEVSMDTQLVSTGRKRLKGTILNTTASKRRELWPVGLLNVGNSCWFNAVIQTFFNLPFFRNFLFHHSINEENFQLGDKNTHLLLELRRLFAQLLATEYSFVDPSLTLNLIEVVLDTASHRNQQDASEFIHKLLEWLENMFNRLSTAQPHSDLSHSLKRMFYGELKTETFRHGKLITSFECFSQFVLFVSSNTEFYQAAEASLVSLLSKQWFVKLPPVLVFELSRFEFNQETERTDKIHNKLSFPQLIYMDRYLERNRNLVNLKRAEFRRLCEKRELCLKQLKKYTEYGVSENKDNLSSLLENSYLYFHSISQDQAELDRLDFRLEDIGTVKNYLQRSYKFVNKRICQLESEIELLCSDILQIFSHSSMKQVPYRLHAVLIHDGEAISGHYWSYIFCPKRLLWFKFNDTCVTESSWEQLQLEGFGGHMNMSAYCLIYCDTNNTEIAKDDFEVRYENGEMIIPSQIKNYLIQTENSKFNSDEIQKNSRTHTLPDNESRIAKITLSDEHARICYEDTISAIDSVLSFHGSHTPKQLLCLKVYQNETIRAKKLSSSYDMNDWSQLDCRLTSFLVYLLYNEVQMEQFTYWALLEQFSCSLLTTNCKYNELFKHSSTELNDFILKQSVSTITEYNTWHLYYESFITISCLIITSLEHFINARYNEAIVYFNSAVDKNHRLIGDNENSQKKGFSYEVFCEIRFLYVKSFNQQLLNDFKSHRYEQICENVSTLLIPLLIAFKPTSSQKERSFIESIRNDWCVLLGESHSIGDDGTRVLSTVITSLFEISSGETSRELSYACIVVESVRENIAKKLYDLLVFIHK